MMRLKFGRIKSKKIYLLHQFCYVLIVVFASSLFPSFAFEDGMDQFRDVEIKYCLAKNIDAELAGKTFTFNPRSRSSPERKLFSNISYILASRCIGTVTEKCFNEWYHSSPPYKSCVKIEYEAWNRLREDSFGQLFTFWEKVPHADSGRKELGESEVSWEQSRNDDCNYLAQRKGIKLIDDNGICLRDTEAYRAIWLYLMLYQYNFYIFENKNLFFKYDEFGYSLIPSN